MEFLGLKDLRTFIILGVMVWQRVDTSFCKGIVCPKDGSKKIFFVLVRLDLGQA
jgi:hypothetical protein